MKIPVFHAALAIVMSLAFVVGRCSGIHTGGRVGDRIFIGEFILTSEPPGRPDLYVFKKLNATDLEPWVDAPVKILGISGNTIFGEKVFLAPPKWDLTRDLVAPQLEAGATSVYFMLSSSDPSVRWFSDPDFTKEITHLVPQRHAITVGKSEPRKHRSGEEK